MVTNHNGGANGNNFMRVRWKMITACCSAVFALSIIFGTVISYAQSSTAVELKCNANEKRIEKCEKIQDEILQRLGSLESGVKTANTNLDWIKDALKKRRP